MNDTLRKHIEAELQVQITSVEQVYGGDINKTYVAKTSNGKLFVKVNDDSKPDMLEKEFAGLQLLRSIKAISIPKPLQHGKSGSQLYLVMEHLEKGTAKHDFWQIFGRQLAALHHNNAESFGLDHHNYIGSLPQINSQCNNWSEFYAEHRILFLIKMAFDAKRCDSSDIRMVEKLCNKMDTLFPEEPPALLHGDLWSGNYMADQNGQPAIYDPAVYYGHREMDIGMTLLFGGFNSSFYVHYNEAHPLEKNWKSRVDLTQLYPLLVHLNLFGGHYYHSVRDVLKKYS